MKLPTLVKIAVTSSVVLLCAGFALYSFFRLSSAANQQDFNLYTLVPTSAIAIFETDDVAEMVSEIEGITCSKKQKYLHVSKLFSYLKESFYTIQEDTPHGLSRQMNQVLISFHEPDNDRNQVLYCGLGSGDKTLIDKFVEKYASLDYPPKIFNYKGAEISIYPMTDGDFLSCYLTSDFMALSYQKKLVEEVIDAQKTRKSLATDRSFFGEKNLKKGTSVANIYARLKGGIGWTTFDMRLKDDLIYFSGTSHDVDSCSMFVHMLCRQDLVKGFSEEILPSTTFYFSKQGVVADWSPLLSCKGTSNHVNNEKEGRFYECDKEMLRYLIENTGRDLVTCLFHREDTLLGSAAIISLSVVDVVEAERALRLLTINAHAENDTKKKSNVTFCNTLSRAYPIYDLPSTTLFTQLTHSDKFTSFIYATFYGGRLLIAPDVDSLSHYIHQLEAGEVLEDTLFRASTDGLSNSYHFMLMADFEQILGRSENNTCMLPDFFFRHPDFFRHFIFFAQLSCTDGVIFHNIVLKYKSE